MATSDSPEPLSVFRMELEHLRDNGYQPMYNGRPSCPFCANFLDDEETHTESCPLVGFLAASERPPVDELRAELRSFADRASALWWQPEDPHAGYADPRSHSQSAQIEVRSLLERIYAALASPAVPEGLDVERLDRAVASAGVHIDVRDPIYDKALRRNVTPTSQETT